ncbi:MAG: hypothetical protein AAGI48_02920 [Verrucomicrobiota bacterium]
MKYWWLCCLLAGLAIGAEESREWTDVKGRKLKGTLVAKDELNAEVLMKNGRKVKIPLKKLSEADQEYVAKADVHPDPEIEVRTSRATGDGGKYDFDIRAIEATIEKTHERPYTLVVIWLGKRTSNVGIFLSEEFKVERDHVKKKFEVTYDWKTYADNDHAKDYSGYVVGLLDESGGTPRWVTHAVSMKPYVRFLDEYLETRGN